MEKYEWDMEERDHVQVSGDFERISFLQNLSLWQKMAYECMGLAAVDDGIGLASLGRKYDELIVMDGDVVGLDHGFIYRDGGRVRYVNKCNMGDSFFEYTVGEILAFGKYFYQRGLGTGGLVDQYKSHAVESGDNRLLDLMQNSDVLRKAIMLADVYRESVGLEERK